MANARCGLSHWEISIFRKGVAPGVGWAEEVGYEDGNAVVDAVGKTEMKRLRNCNDIANAVVDLECNAVDLVDAVVGTSYELIVAVEDWVMMKTPEVLECDCFSPLRWHFS